MMKKRLALVSALMIVMAALLLAVAAGDRAEAAKGGNATRGGGSSATLKVSPNPIPVGSTSVVISGTGFSAGQSVQVITGFVPSAWATADSNGNFSVTYQHTFSMPDSASMQAWSTNRHPSLLATAYYTVQ